MEIFNSNKYGELDIRALDNFEKNNEVVLPADYRQFLIDHNGGCPIPNVVKITYTHTDIQILYGMFWSPDFGSLFYNLDVYLSRVPDFYLPIGNDSGGNLFLLSLRNENYGAVYFWRHEQELKEGDAGEYFENVEFLADSFSEFLLNLIELE